MNRNNSDETMKVSNLHGILAAILHKTKEDYQIWLSNDEEGNEITPMHRSMQISICIDDEGKRVIFFPQH